MVEFGFLKCAASPGKKHLKNEVILWNIAP
jgi:hypothetical protein